MFIIYNPHYNLIALICSFLPQGRHFGIQPQIKPGVTENFGTITGVEKYFTFNESYDLKTKDSSKEEKATQIGKKGENGQHRGKFYLLWLSGHESTF